VADRPLSSHKQAALVAHRDSHGRIAATCIGRWPATDQDRATVDAAVSSNILLTVWGPNESTAHSVDNLL
jgi:hypothetical protein